MKISLKTLLISSIVFALIAVAFAIFLSILIDRGLENVAKIDQDIANEEVQKKNVESVEKVLEKTKESRDELATYILQDANIVSIVETIEKLGEKNSLAVTITGLEAEDSFEAKAGTINNVKMHVDAKGNWSNLLTFMILVENIPYKSTIDSVILRKSTLESSVSDKSLPGWSLGFNIKLLKIK